jgi:uncharacterized membrane protein HdeD (DUF308 family)
VALRGVAAIVFGIMCLCEPRIGVAFLVLMFGVYAIVDGVLALALATQPVPRRFALIARGLVSIAAGIVALMCPGMTAFVLLMTIACWAIVCGALEVITAIQLCNEVEGEWLLAAEGVLSIAFGVLLMMSPLAGAIALGLWVGIHALVRGGMLIITSLRLRSFQHAHPVLAAA